MFSMIVDDSICNKPLPFMRYRYISTIVIYPTRKFGASFQPLASSKFWIQFQASASNEEHQHQRKQRKKMSTSIAKS